MLARKLKSFTLEPEYHSAFLDHPFFSVWVREECFFTVTDPRGPCCRTAARDIVCQLYLFPRALLYRRVLWGETCVLCWYTCLWLSLLQKNARRRPSVITVVNGITTTVIMNSQKSFLHCLQYPGTVLTAADNLA